MNVRKIALAFCLLAGFSLVPQTAHAKISSGNRKALAAYLGLMAAAVWWCSDNQEEVVRSKGGMPPIKKHHIFGALQLIGVTWSAKCSWKYFREGKNPDYLPLVILAAPLVGKIVKDLKFTENE